MPDYLFEFLFLFLLGPLFLELVSGPSSSSAFCSASNIANYNVQKKRENIVEEN